MRASWISAVAIALIAALCSCSAPGSGNSGVTLSPSNGSTDQLIDVAVSGTFTKAIGEPQWPTVFTLIENGQSTSLCTSYTYDASVSNAPRITCAHDALKNGTTYNVEILPFLGCSGNRGSFTTIAAVASVIKRAILQAENSDRTYAVTFSFGSPLARTIAPTVTLALPDTPAGEISDCTFDEERTALTCPVVCSGADAPDTDCTLTLGGDGVDETSLTLSEIEDAETP